MPLLWITRFIASVLSAVLFAAMIYLLWTWAQGYEVRDVRGIVHHVRDNWRLWIVLALAAWSLLGGFITRLILARSDHKPTQFDRADGEMIEGSKGTSLYAESIGPKDAPTVILTHGWALDSTIWANTKTALSRQYRVISWDLPGMGKSKASAHAVSLENFAADLALVIDWSGAGRVLLVGHSIGGMATQTLARDHADLVSRRVAGVILVNTTDRNPLRTMLGSSLCLALQKPVLVPMMYLTKALNWLAWLSAWQGYLNGTAHIANRLAFASKVMRRQLDYITLLTTRNSPARQADGNLAMFRWQARAAFAGLKVPVLILAGHRDLVTMPHASKDIVADTPEATLRIIDDANHMGFLERAEVYNDAMIAFADQVFAKESAPAHARAS